MIARIRSITRGDLECLEFMLATTDLLSHHMRILLLDQRGPYEIQAKYMGNSSCHSILIPLFWLRVWWGSQWPWNHSPARSPHTQGNQKHQCIAEAPVERWPGYLKRETPRSNFGENVAT